MQGLKTDLAPSRTIVVPHFIFAAISLFAFSVLLVLSHNDLTKNFFQPSLLALTHIAALGWGTMIIFGALYQLIPVVMETALYSEGLAKLNFYLFGIGIVILVGAFWHFSTHLLLPLGAAIVFFSFLLFTINILKTTLKAGKKSIQSSFIGMATFWLLLTGLVGALISFNYRFNFLDQSHLHYLKIHALLGMAGWFLMLVMGIGSLLLPMFFISHQLKQWKLQTSFYLVTVGLSGLAIYWWIFRASFITPVFTLIITLGILFFMSYLYDSYKKRMRKKLDLGLKHTVLSLILFLLPITLGILVSFKTSIDYVLLNRFYLLYVFTFFMGFITSIILGQTYKTLPFIIWLDKYKNLVGKGATPMPRELYSETVAQLQFWSYIFAIVALIAGILLSLSWSLWIGSILMLICSLLYNLNVFKIISHNVKTINNEES